MHEIRVSIASPEAADHGVAELWAAGEQIGYTVLDDSDLMLRIEPRRDHTVVVVGARSLARFPAAFSANPRKGSPTRLASGRYSVDTLRNTSRRGKPKHAYDAAVRSQAPNRR